MIYFDCWELCEVTVEEVIMYSLRWQYLIYRMDFWTFVDFYLGKVPFPYSLLRCHVSSENNWRTSLGKSNYCSSAHNMVSLYSPISGYQPYQSYTIQFFCQQKRKYFIGQSQLVISSSRFRLRTSIHFEQSHWSNLSEKL